MNVNMSWRELELQVSHRHSDGSWAPMRQVPSHHDAAQHDPEREWPWHRIFKCDSCEETITVTQGDDSERAEER
jgi:hypothetical protein